jgi:stage III sporulation protein AH
MPQVAVFADYRMELERVRAAQIELLQTVLEDKELSAAQREQLNAELMQIMQRSEAELQAETLLRAKGYLDAIVVITQSGANVVVPVVLTKQDAAVIGELTARAAGIPAERITIIDGAS